MAALAERLRLSKAEAERLAGWAAASLPQAGTAESAFAKMLYRGRPQAFEDRLRLALAAARAKAVTDDGALVEAAGYARLLAFLGTWRRPVFPLKGGDLLKLGVQEGEDVGRRLAALEEKWIASGFSLTRKALLESAAQEIGREERSGPAEPAP
jgi:hypothetical protein